MLKRILFTGCYSLLIICILFFAPLSSYLFNLAALKFNPLYIYLVYLYEIIVTVLTSIVSYLIHNQSKFFAFFFTIIILLIIIFKILLLISKKNMFFLIIIGIFLLTNLIIQIFVNGKENLS